MSGTGTEKALDESETGSLSSCSLSRNDQVTDEPPPDSEVPDAVIMNSTIEYFEHGVPQDQDRDVDVEVPHAADNKPIQDIVDTSWSVLVQTKAELGLSHPGSPPTPMQGSGTSFVGH